MGRPKGLKKGPDGKWYMPELTKQEIMGGLPTKLQKPIVPEPVRKARTERFKRNDLVSADGQAGLVLGYHDNKLIIQLLDGRTKLTVDESRAVPRQEAD